MGKGCKRRPTEVTDDEFEDNWDGIFKRNSQNIEKNRYKHSDKLKNPAKRNGKLHD